MKYRKLLFGRVVVAMAVIGVVALALISTKTAEAPVIEDSALQEPVVSEQTHIAQPELPWYEPIKNKLQQTVDEWAQKSGGQASVSLLSKDGNTIAVVNEDTPYFTASLYKTFVAYEGYRKVDTGELSADEIYQGNRTLAQCLDVMIRESDSPCAEKLWADLGKQWLNDQVQKYGIYNTDLVSLKTTAYDAGIITARIARGEGLSDRSHMLLLNSMKDQIYRDALNKGFSGSSTVYNKIGFNYDQEYHDVAYVTFTDEKNMVVSVMTSGVGSRKISQLGTDIQRIVAGD